MILIDAAESCLHLASSQLTHKNCSSTEIMITYSITFTMADIQIYPIALSCGTDLENLTMQCLVD